MKKRVLSVTLCAVILFSLAAFAGCGNGSDAVTLNVYNWGEYIDATVLDTFTEQTGIKVNYSTYDSNESMYAKVSSGAANYDIVIPSDYMISKMAGEGLLAELDFANIPNYSFIRENFKGLEFDPENKYSVPYTWGTVVIIYNTKMVDAADAAPQSIDLLWNEKYSGQILMFDNPRDAFGLALKKLGFSMNTAVEVQWDAAAQELKEQRPLLQAYVMDQIFDKMVSGEAAIAPYYAGDALTMMEDNPDLACYVPYEGVNMFVDSMCVLKSSTHKTEAEKFINFMCETDIAVKTAQEIGYATPHTGAFEKLDAEITSNEIAYPSDEVLANTETFLNLSDEIGQLQSDLWTDIKTD